MSVSDVPEAAGSDASGLGPLPAFHALRQIVWLLRPDGSVERFNPFWTEYTGLPAVVAGLEWSAVFHPEDRQRLVNARTLGVASRSPYEVEARMRRADGVYRRHLCRVVPTWRDGELAGWVGTAIDVEDVRAAEDAARESERRKQKVLEAMSDGYYRLDRAFRIVEVNGAFERMTGRSRREVIGENLWAVFPGAPDSAAYTSVPFRGTRREVRFSHSINRWAEVTIYRGEDGFEVYFRDIEDQKRVEVWQAALMRVAQSLRAGGESVDVTEVGAAVVGEALGATRAGYAKMLPGGEESLVLRARLSAPTRQQPSTGRFRNADWGGFHALLGRGEIVAIDDVARDPLTAPAAATWADWGVRSVAFVPLMFDGRLDGYLFVADKRCRRWDPAELQFARTVADLVWAAMARSGELSGA